MIVSGAAIAKVKGIQMRLENKTAAEAFDVIIDSENLLTNKVSGIIYVFTREEIAHRPSPDFLDEDFAPTLFARFKKGYYDALIAEGFSPQQALKLTVEKASPTNLLHLDASPAKDTTTTPTATPGGEPAASDSDDLVNSFNHTPIRKALLPLARSGGMNMVVSPKVDCDVSFNFDGLTPGEVIDLIVVTQGLVMTERNGVFFVMTRPERSQQLHIFGSEALPQALARFDHRYLKALVTKGFTREQALKVVAGEKFPIEPLKPAAE